MHPNEMKNAALTAAAKAEQDGFTATAKAFLQLAEVCVGEAMQIVTLASQDRPIEEQCSSPGVVRGTWLAAGRCGPLVFSYDQTLPFPVLQN